MPQAGHPVWDRVIISKPLPTCPAGLLIITLLLLAKFASARTVTNDVDAAASASTGGIEFSPLFSVFLEI
jgi:hypothetical protein